MTMTTTANPVRSTPRKIRSDSKLDSLTPEQQAAVRFWLVEENRSYAYVAHLVLTQFKMTVGQSALGVYYQRHIIPDLRREQEDIATEFATIASGDFDLATIEHAKALAFSALTRPDPQVRTAARLLDLAHHVENQEIIREKQSIARERLALEKRRVALREQELATRPPQKPRASHTERRALPPPDPVHAQDQPYPAGTTPAPITPPPATPTSAIPAPVTAVSPPCPPCPNPPSPAYTDLRTPNSDLRSSRLSPKTPENPPLSPGYSGVSRPPAPPVSPTPPTPPQSPISASSAFAQH